MEVGLRCRVAGFGDGDSTVSQERGAAAGCWEGREQFVPRTSGAPLTPRFGSGRPMLKVSDPRQQILSMCFEAVKFAEKCSISRGELKHHLSLCFCLKLLEYG